MVRRTKEDAMETRSKLLDAAEAFFRERGVTHTSMMHVAEKAGVTRGAIYHHFENKMDLIESLMGRVKLPIDEMREQIADGTVSDPLTEIQERSKGFIARIESNPQVRSLASILLHKCEYIDEVNPIKLRHVSGRNECIDDFEKLFEEAVKKEQLSATVTPRAAVIGLFSLVDGLIYNWLLAPDYFPLVEYGNTAIENYLNGLPRQP